MAERERENVEMNSEMVLFTDGACLGNPGPGGWGVLLKSGETAVELSGGDPATTNNRMELLAVIRGLESLDCPTKLTVYTDSRYVKDGITQWIHNWRRNGWKTAAGCAVKNVDLWQQLTCALEPHTVSWMWVKGHSGHPENTRVDHLAREAAKNITKKG